MVHCSVTSQVLPRIELSWRGGNKTFKTVRVHLSFPLGLIIYSQNIGPRVHSSRYLEWRVLFWHENSFQCHERQYYWVFFACLFFNICLVSSLWLQSETRNTRTIYICIPNEIKHHSSAFLWFFCVTVTWGNIVWLSFSFTLLSFNLHLNFRDPPVHFGRNTLKQSSCPRKHRLDGFGWWAYEDSLWFRDSCFRSHVLWIRRLAREY